MGVSLRVFVSTQRRDHTFHTLEYKLHVIERGQSVKLSRIKVESSQDAVLSGFDGEAPPPPTRRWLLVSL